MNAVERNQTIVFRESRSREEFLRLLRLRYRVFRGSTVKHFEPEHPRGFNLDRFDPTARHFGVFVEGVRKPQPIGYVRMVDNEPRGNRLGDRSRGRLPILEYWPERKEVITVYERLGGDRARIIEGSRLAVLPDFASWSLGKFTLECAVAIAFFVRQGTAALIGCRPAHRRYYERVGFAPTPGTTTHALPDGLTACCLQARMESIPPQIRNRCSAISRQFLASGCVRYRESGRVSVDTAA